ncbi:MAG: zinc ribbon domain-containing protein, partial [Bacteroidaceae bacterium]
MSLIKCPECGKVFSDRAAHCPQCGLPTSDALKSIVDDPSIPNPQPSNPTPQPSPSPSPSPYPTNYKFIGAKKPNSALLYTLICVVIVLAIVVIALLVHDKFGSGN